jgi:LIM domain kinase 1
VHRFTLIKLGMTTKTKRLTSSAAGGKHHHAPTTSTTHGWSALDYFFFASGLLPGGGAKCDICTKRLGRKAVLECDDCGLRAHVKCGEVAPRDCELRACSSLARVTSAPPPARVAAWGAVAAGPGGGGKAKAKVPSVLPSPFSHR